MFYPRLDKIKDKKNTNKAKKHKQKPCIKSNLIISSYTLYVILSKVTETLYFYLLQKIVPNNKFIHAVRNVKRRNRFAL